MICFSFLYCEEYPSHFLVEYEEGVVSKFGLCRSPTPYVPLRGGGSCFNIRIVSETQHLCAASGRGILFQHSDCVGDPTPMCRFGEGILFQHSDCVGDPPPMSPSGEGDLVSIFGLCRRPTPYVPLRGGGSCFKLRIVSETHTKSILTNLALEIHAFSDMSKCLRIFQRLNSLDNIFKLA